MLPYIRLVFSSIFCLSCVSQKTYLGLQDRKFFFQPLPKKECQLVLNQTADPTWRWSFNSGNRAKIREFLDLFSRLQLPLNRVTKVDLREIWASDTEVIFHKASQLPHQGLIVEDSSLDVESLDVGVRLKQYVEDVPLWVGKKAVLHSLLAYRVGETVFVFKRSVPGSLVPPRGIQESGGMISSYFEPRGLNKTLAEGVEFEGNPRAMALKDLKEGRFVLCGKQSTRWDGPWQEG
jgi:inosine/xanthosine triphosphate pyrophosphatase family protein